MIKKNDINFFLSFEVGNTKINITNSGGFFKNKLTGTSGAIHNHSAYELHTVLEGTATLESKTGTVTLQKNEACLIPPNLLHYPISIAPDGTRMSFCFTYDKTNTKEANDTYIYFKAALDGLCDVTKLYNAGEISSTLNNLLAEFYTGGTFCEQRLIAYFTLIITEIISELEKEPKSHKDALHSPKGTGARALTRTVMEEYVNLRFPLNPSISELAELIHFSYKQTTRLFEKYFGTTFKKYVIGLRIDSAKYFLENTDISVEEISLKVGYESYNGFYRIFLSHVGIPPLEYREKRKTNK